ncbi:hypothetical protein BCR42DRAFT_404046 [Absidia repens]|uniref:Uncharacterized protein n=1 Tax=Absidia repens TaxID=90262 RepID=A0A1X2IVR5_9FUNG|nr:hypothetical protein BCR42DRAFT_404046 [Absidia repens]
MNNPLKRHSSYGDIPDLKYDKKRKKFLHNEPLSPNLRPCADIPSLSVSHFPPSPPIIADTPTLSSAWTPSPSFHSAADSIPTLKKFTITTRHQQQQEQQEHTTSDYVNINQILHEAHIQRHGVPPASIPTDSDMMDFDDVDNNYNNNDNGSRYDYANTILRHAFLQRHSSPPS